MHGYWSINFDILHTTATDQLPFFVKQLQAVFDVLQTMAPEVAEDEGPET